MNLIIFKACDIRGVFGRELTIEHATALGHALAIREKPAEVLVGGDGRLSTQALKNALIHALVECGVRVRDVGTVPTPIFYYSRRQTGMRAGVMVTASHNPATDNGFKIILGDLPITEVELDELRALMESQVRCDAAVGTAATQARGQPSSVERESAAADLASSSEQFQSPERPRGEVVPLRVVEDYILFTENLDRTRGQLKIVLDSGNGMWGPLAPRIFRDLGYAVVELFSEVDGQFPNRPPNPAVAANLTALCADARGHSAALGVAYDGDGDRVAFVDERGGPVDNGRIIALFAREALGQDLGAVIVYDQKCSDVVREEIIRHGGVCAGRKVHPAKIRPPHARMRSASASWKVYATNVLITC